MNRFFNLLGCLAILASVGCSEYTTVPQYVSVEKLNLLDPGMDKSAVSKALGALPFDAYHSTESGCELYSYKYLHKKQEIKPDKKEDETSLKGNEVVYEDANDAFLYFEEGKLTSIITANADHDREFVAELDKACLGPIRGCTDAEALNYNDEADEDDDSCEYCPCGFYMNPDYDEKRECGERCLPEEVEEVEEEDEEDCSLCDLVQTANSNVTLNVTAANTVSTAPVGKSGRRGSGLGQANSNSRSAGKASKADRTVSKGTKSKSASELSRSANKKLEKLQAQLEKSKKKDSKRGKESKKTKLLKAAIAKIEAKG
jgi:hypothetical protein